MLRLVAYQAVCQAELNNLDQRKTQTNMITLIRSFLLRVALGTLLALALMNVTSTLAQVVTPVSVTASSVYSAGQNPVNLINGNGLLGTGDILTRTHDANSTASTMWHSSGGAVNTNVLIFDLGAQFTLTAADIWQMNQPCCLGRGVKTFGLFVSSNTTDPITSYVGTFSLNQGSGTTNEHAQRLVFSASNVRCVMFACSNDWNNLANDYVGLSEVRFEGTAPPNIAQQPQSATNYVWGVQTFSVTAGGSTPLAYQWYRDGAPPTAIAGATNASYIIDPVTNSSAGGYLVVVTNLLGSATSVVATLTVSNPPPDITSALLAYFPFDETNGTSAADASGNGVSATLFNFPTDDSMWVTGRVGRALEFNALDTVNNNQVITDTALNLANEDFFTFAFWAKRRSDNNPFNPRFVGPVSPVDGQYWVLWSPANHGVGFYPPVASPEPIRDVWQHFVVTYDRLAGKYETYVDGRKKSEATSTSYLKTSPAGRQWAIGCKEVLTAFTDPWRGFLDDMRIYNRILLPGDVKALYEVAGSVAPSFSVQPQSVSIFVGEMLRLRSAVDGTPPITYQWYRYRTNILVNAADLTLVLTNVQAGDAGDYTLVAANALKAATSAVAHVTVTPVTSVTNGLAGYWKFDEASGATAADSSGEGNLGTVNNSLLDGGHWTSAGKVGGALTFRGPSLGDDYVVVPNWPKALNGTMTLSAWVWAEALPDQARIACGGSGGDGIGQFLFTQSTGGNDLRGYVQSSARVTSDTRENVMFPTNSWQHVVLVADGTTCHIYRNGVEVGSVAYDGTLFNPTNALSIGARLTADDSAAESGWWQGKIDDVAYWTRGLSASEVFELFAAGSAGRQVTTGDIYATSPPMITVQPQGGSVYLHESISAQVSATGVTPLTYQWWKDGGPIANATNRVFINPSADFSAGGNYAVVITAGNGGSVTSAPAAISISAPTPQPDTGLVLYLKLDEKSGPTAADSTTNADNGSLVNFLNPDTNWVPGVINGALSFSQGAPNSDAIAVSAQPYLDFGTDAFSLSLWAKGSSVQTASGGLLCKGLGGGGEAYCIDIWNSSYRFFVRNSLGQANAANMIPSGVIPNSQWQHLAVTYDPTLGQSRMYVNGALVGTAATADAVFSNADTLDIGARQYQGGYTLNWAGLLDDVRVYGRAITPLEIRALSYQGHPPTLTIAPAGGKVAISWPLEAVGYELQSSSTLVGGSWSTASGVTTNSVTLTPSGSAQYYRLHRK